jgi:hypothetical protein
MRARVARWKTCSFGAIGQSRVEGLRHRGCTSTAEEVHIMFSVVRRTATACVGVALILSWPSSSSADDDSSHGESRPGPVASPGRLLASGLLTFGLAYVPAVTSANASSLSVDRQLYVPVVGPWIDLGTRPNCGRGSLPCNSETLNQGLLIADGFFQGLAVVQLLAGLGALAHDSATTSSKADERPSVHVSPTQVGTNGYGVAAIGKF